MRNYYGLPNTVWLNDGTGFADGPVQDLGNGWSVQGVLGDLDLDGDLDLVVANAGAPNTMWRNDGGVFTEFFQFDADLSYSAALGDLNGDGLLDVVVANYEDPNTIWLNNDVLFTEAFDIREQPKHRCRAGRSRR